MKLDKEKTLRKSKAKARMFSTISSSMYTNIMSLKTTKDIWDYLKKEYQGNDRTLNMQILNLIREFEMMKMKEAETIMEYSNTLLGITNKIRLLDKDFRDNRIVQKLLVTLPEKYESKDLSSISLAELVGFDMVDAFAESVGIQMEDVHCKAIFGKGFLNGVPVFLAKPQTYMNLSGESFHDDMDLPCGVLRLHPKGGIGRPPMDPKAFLLQKFNATARERDMSLPGSSRGVPQQQDRRSLRANIN
nr:peptidyl-tRNA hydrolase, mitochondrial-like isoform X2 [Ipomoea batatas]